jgi:general secretion pathway protein G
MNRKTERGFTLVELMVVIVLIGLLAGAVSVGVFGVLLKGKNTAARSQIEEFEKAIQLYYMEFARYPETLDELTSESMEGSEEPFLEDIPLDPWDEEYIYDPQGGTKKRYLIVSMGEDRALDTDDDITNEDTRRKEQ